MQDIPLDSHLQSYDYHLPEENIAQHPPAERGKSRLLVLDRTSGEVTDSTFAELVNHLPQNCLLIANNSRVLPARLHGHKPTGGKVEFLLLSPLPLITPEVRDGWNTAQVECLLRASKGPRVGELVTFNDNLNLEVLEKGEFGRSQVLLRWQGDLATIMDDAGHIPLPPYITREDSQDDRDRYQTIYSREDKKGSVAAPTAGLHFTPQVRKSLEDAGHDWAEVTLYVGYGTFSPVRAEDIRDHSMHSEYIEISEDTAAKIRNAKAEGRPVVCVGTTSTRVVEGAFREAGSICAYTGETDIFISPGYKFNVVDHMLTNFHLPLSSLVIMVSAFAGRERVLATYKHAVEQGYRFFSYGDAMFIR